MNPKAALKKTSSATPFLSARWEDLIVINYEIDPALLKPLIPKGTELDYLGKKVFVSLVGFLFRNTKVFGLIGMGPFSDFEEINLRFYIRKKVGSEIRRAVCFVKEIVPFAPIALGAHFFYNEPYVTYPTRRLISLPDEFSYQWKNNGRWIGLKAQKNNPLRKIRKKSIEEFILEHYWGYTSQRDGSVKEYRLQHSPWRYWPAKKVIVDSEVTAFYGKRFSETLKRKPHSAFVAEGSEVKVFFGGKAKAQHEY